MIISMTGFARHSIEKAWGAATIELRSLNYRFLELDFRLPEMWRELEVPMRQLTTEQLRRGKVECHLRYKPHEPTGQQIGINPQMVRQLAQTSAEIYRIWEGPIAISLTEILHWPGVLQTKEADRAVMINDILALFKETLLDLIGGRQREGLAMAQRLNQRLEEMRVEIDKIKRKLPEVMAAQRRKITARAKEFRKTLDPHRVEEEILLLIQKMDVTEEVDRLEIHVAEVQAALATVGAVGRRLDFLMQELHREANTLGSKSSDGEVTHSAIHLKVLIEQMREQVQNIE